MKKMLIALVAILLGTTSAQAGEWVVAQLTTGTVENPCGSPKIDRVTGEVYWWQNDGVVRDGVFVIPSAWPQIVQGHNLGVGGGHLAAITTNFDDGTAVATVDGVTIASGYDASWESSWDEIPASGLRFIAAARFDQAGHYVLPVEYRRYAGGVLQDRTVLLLTPGGTRWFPSANENTATSASQYLWPFMFAGFRGAEPHFLVWKGSWELYAASGTRVTMPTFASLSYAVLEDDQLIICGQRVATTGVNFIYRYHLVTGELAQLSEERSNLADIAGEKVFWTTPGGNGSTVVRVLVGGQLRPPLTINYELEGGPPVWSGDKVVWSGSDFQIRQAVWQETAAVSDWEKY